MVCILPKYRPSNEEFRELWEKCVFVPDSSLLLGLYRYSPILREGILDVFKKIPDRIWIPHQVGLEYLDNKENIIKEETNKYKITSEILDESIKDLKSKLNKNDLFRKNEATSAISQSLVDKIRKNIKDELVAIKECYPQRDVLENIDVTIMELFTGKVGEPSSLNMLKKISKDGMIRYDLELPPGYKDRGKGGIKEYGDLIIWFQIMDMAKTEKRPVIFILDDLKDDWWWKSRGKIDGPRYELILEFVSETSMNFYMYTIDQFLKYSKDFIRTEIKAEVIEEAEKYTTDEENRLKRIDEIAESMAKNPNFYSGVAVAIEQRSKMAEAFANNPNFYSWIAAAVEQRSKMAEAFANNPNIYSGIAAAVEQRSKIAEAFANNPNIYSGVAAAIEQGSKMAEAFAINPNIYSGIAAAIEQRSKIAETFQNKSKAVVKTKKDEKDLNSCDKGNNDG
jgi:hypothetical protein